jgi:hypothetical protein
MGSFSRCYRMVRYLITPGFLAGVILASLSSQVGHASCTLASYRIKRHDILSIIILRQERKLHLRSRIYGANGLLALTLNENPQLGNLGNLIIPGKKIKFPLKLSVPKAMLASCSGSDPLARNADGSRGLSGGAADYEANSDTATQSSSPQENASAEPAAEAKADPAVETKSESAIEYKAEPKAEPKIEATTSDTAQTDLNQGKPASSQEAQTQENDSKDKATEVYQSQVPASEPIASVGDESRSASSSSPFDAKNSKVDLDLGLGLMVADSAAGLSFPQFYVRSRINLTPELDLLAMVGGFLPTYTAGTSSTLEGQARLVAGYKLLDDRLTVGLGVRYFLFGYSSPVAGIGTGGSTFDGVLLGSYKWAIDDKFSLEGTVDLRFPFFVSGATADQISSSFQFGGFGLFVKGGYALNEQFSVGPYLYLNYINLGWTQGASTGAAFSATEFGLGANLNIKF